MRFGESRVMTEARNHHNVAIENYESPEAIMHAQSGSILLD
jgi:hypothetical protein